MLSNEIPFMKEKKPITEKPSVSLAKEVAELHEQSSAVAPERVALAAEAVAKVRNYHYVLFLTAAVAVLNTLFLAVDFFTLPQGSDVQHLYFSLHGVTAIVMAANFIYVKTRKRKYLASAYIFFGGIQILAVGIAFSAIDQLRSGSIAPYLVSSMIIAAFLYYRRLFSIILQTAGFAVFMALMIILQKEQSVVVSHLVNGIQVYILALLVGLFRDYNLKRETGYFLMSSSLADTVSDYSMKAYNLTEREREIFNLLLLGASNKDISDKLTITVATVKTHVTSIFRKLKVNTRGQMMKLFYKG